MVTASAGRKGNGDGDTAPERRPLRIGVAEDDHVMTLWYEKILPEMGHSIAFVARTGQELIEQARAQPPDLVLSDIRLPGLDGIDACERVYEEKPMPVILVSAYFSPEQIARAEQSHALTYLVKPIEPQHLRPAISLALGRFRQMQELRSVADEARQALEDRKLIERAKAVLMKRLRLDDPDAYRRLQLWSHRTNRKMTDVAREVLSRDELFEAMERVDAPPARS